MTQEILDTISGCRIFSSADPETLREALESSDCFEACFDAGETIRSPEESERRVGVILSGRAKVRSAHESKSVLIKTLEEGELFGVANLFENSAGYVSLIVAEKECRVFSAFTARTASVPFSAPTPPMQIRKNISRLHCRWLSLLPKVLNWNLAILRT